MFRRIVVVIVFLGYLTLVQANNWRKTADSLQYLITEETSDTSKLKIYLELNKILLSNEPQEAMDYAIYAQQIAEKLDNKEGIISSMLQQCDFYIMVGEYNTSLTMAYKALELAKPDPTLQSWCHNRIATVHDAVGNAKETLFHNKRSLHFSSLSGDSSEIIVDIHNIGRIYIDLELYDSALHYLRIANKYDIKHLGRPDPYSLSNIGNVFLELEKYDSALYYHLAAYKYDVLDDQKYLMGIDQQFIAKTYFEMGKLEDAKEFALKSIEIADELNAYDIAIDNYEILYQIYLAEGDYKSSIEYALKYSSTKDTLYTNAKQSLLLGLETKHKVKEQAEKLALVEKQKALYFILAGVSILFLLSMIIIVILVNRKRRVLRELTKQLQLANESKERLLSIISHDLRGSVGTLRTAAKAISDGLTNKKDTHELLESFYPVADSTLDLLENLLTWAKCNKEKITPEIESLNLKEVVGKSIDHINHLALSKSVEIVHYLQDEYVLADRNMLLSIIRNILSNAIKFSHSDSKVLISHVKKNGQIIISVVDHGVGIAPEALDMLFKDPESVQNQGTYGERGSGLGIMICKNFIEALEGSIWAESIKGKGTTFFLSIPAIN